MAEPERLGPPRVEAAGRPRLDWLRIAVVITASAALGGVLVAASGLSAMVQLLLPAAIAVGTAMFWSRDLKSFLLWGMVFTSPIGITKSIVTHGGVYSPSLELYPADLFAIGLLVVWLVDRKVMRRMPTRIALGGTVTILWMAWWAVGVLVAPDRFSALMAYVNLLKSFVMFILVAEFVETPADIRRVLTAAAAGLALNLVMVFVQFTTGAALNLQGAKIATVGTQLIYDGTGGASAFRPAGFMLHPNKMAAHLVLTLPMLLLFSLMGPRQLGRRVWSVSTGLLVCGVVALLITLSRGGWISFGVAAIVAIFVACRRRLVRPSRVVTVGIAAILLIASVLAVYPQVIYRLTQGDDRSTESRLLMIDQALLIIREHPLIGVGVSAYTATARSEIPPSFSSVSQAFKDQLLIGVVHQNYLLIWAEGGIVALILTLLQFGTFLRSHFRVRSWDDPVVEAVSLGIVAGLVGLLTFYFFDHFYFDFTRYTVWTMFGILAAMARFRRRESSVELLRAAA